MIMPTLFTVTLDVILGNIDYVGVRRWKLSVIVTSVVEELLEEFIGILLLY
jgi:hypothetical protein